MNAFYISGIILFFINSTLLGLNIAEGDITFAVVNLIGIIFSIIIIHTEYTKRRRRL